MQNRIYDLEQRLVDYTCRMIDVVEALSITRAGNYIAGQLTPLGTHRLLIMVKLKAQNPPRILFTKWVLFLKNSRNAGVALKNYLKKKMINPVKKLEGVCKETEELIAIVAKSIITAKNNNKV